MTIQFWQNLRNSKEEVKENKRFLVLPEKQTWGGVHDQGNIMYVRHCYEQLFQIIDTDWDKTNSHFLLLGTPGIGKSYFLYYVAWKLLTKLRTSMKPFKVIVQSGSEGGCHFLCSAGTIFKNSINVKEVDDSTVHKHLADANNYYLIDSSLPHFTPNAKTLLVSYPDPKLYDYYDRHSVVKKLYMPTWSLGELEIARRNIYTLCDETAFYANFEKLGGVPRFILYRPQHLPVEDQNIMDEYIHESLALMESGKRQFIANLLSDSVFEPNEVVHYEVPAYDFSFKHHYVKFASLHVARIVVQGISDKQKLEMGRLLKNVALTHAFAQEKLDLFNQAIILGFVEEWPRRFKSKYLRGLRLSGLDSIVGVEGPVEFLKVDHVKCGNARLMNHDDISHIENERVKRGYRAMWALATTPQVSGIDGVYMDDKHISLLYTKPIKDKKVDCGALREIMTAFRSSRSVWLHNFVLEPQFHEARSIEYEGYPEEISFIDDNITQFALTLSLDFAGLESKQGGIATPRNIHLEERPSPSLASPRTL